MTYQDASNSSSHEIFGTGRKERVGLVKGDVCYNNNSSNNSNNNIIIIITIIIIIVINIQ